MTEKFERRVFVLQSYLKPFPKDAPYLYMPKIASLLIDIVNNNNAKALYNKEKVLYRIREACVKENRYFIMLIGFSDKDAPDPSFENFDTGQVKNISKNEHEGRTHAAHIVIDLKPLKSNKHLNTVLLEHLPGLSSSRIKMFLTHLIKKNFKETYKNINNDEKNYRATLELDGHVSHTLMEALKGGTLKNVSLIEHEIDNDGDDEEDYIAEKNYHVDIKIKPDITSYRAIDVIKNLQEKCKTSDTNKYDKMVVQIENASGNIKTTRLTLSDDKDLFSEAFYHQEKIAGFDPSLEDSPIKIRDDVVAKMIKLIPDKDEK